MTTDAAQATSNTAGYDAAEEFLHRRTPLQRVQHTLHTYPWLSPLVVLVLAVVVFSLLNPAFLRPTNLGTIAQQTAVIATLALGQTLIILTAGIDLSCGAVMVFSSMVMAKTAFDQGVPGLVAIILGIVVGALAGALNGLLITRLNLPPFIVTLGTLGIFTSLTLIYATGRTIRDQELAPEMEWLGAPIKLPGGAIITSGVIAMLVLYAVFIYVLRYTAWGTHVYAVGDDPDAARLAGIKVKRVLLSVYITAGVIFGIAGWMLIGRIGAASPNAGQDANLDSITAVVIGGTSLFGGRGRVIGSLLGALIVGVVSTGLFLASVDEFYRVGFIGILIIVAVAADQWIRKAQA